MKRQSGFTWVHLIVIVALIAAAAALVAGIYHSGKQAGIDETTAAYAARDNEALKKANTEIQRLQNEARAAEQRKAAEVAAVSTKYQKELANAKAQKERDVAAARAGTLSLRFRTDGPRLGHSGEAGRPATGASRCDGGATAELPREVAADLLGLANDADEVVRQLTACQAVVRADRRP